MIFSVTKVQLIYELFKSLNINIYKYFTTIVYWLFNYDTYRRGYVEYIFGIESN
jgi:hypothetical protein